MVATYRPTLQMKKGINKPANTKPHTTTRKPQAYRNRYMQHLSCTVKSTNMILAIRLVHIYCTSTLFTGVFSSTAKNTQNPCTCCETQYVDVSLCQVSPTLLVLSTLLFCKVIVMSRLCVSDRCTVKYIYMYYKLNSIYSLKHIQLSLRKPPVFFPTYKQFTTPSYTFLHKLSTPVSSESLTSNGLQCSRSRRVSPIGKKEVFSRKKLAI